MKLLLKVSALCAVLMLSSCGANQVEQVRAYTVQICRFLPTVASVTAIINAANPNAAGAMHIATAICAAVSQESSIIWTPSIMPVQDAPKDCPKVNGVCVEGEFVDPDKKEEKK